MDFFNIWAIRCSFPQLPTTWVSTHRCSFPQLPTFDVCQGFMTFGDAGCCGLLLPLAAACWRTGALNGIHFSSLRKQRWSHSRTQVSGASDAAMVVGTSLKSVLKLFLLEGKLIGVCSLEISIRLLGSLPVSGDCSVKRPNEPPLRGFS